MAAKPVAVFIVCQVALCIGSGVLSAIDCGQCGDIIGSSPFTGGQVASTYIDGPPAPTYLRAGGSHIVTGTPYLDDASYIGGTGGSYIGATGTCACLTHRVESQDRPVVDDCVGHVPILKKTVRHQEEHYTRHVPIVEKTLSHQEEKFIRHQPIAQKITRPVVETRIRHVPVTKTRTRTVIEPYTCHVPITERFTRPVEETVVTNVPVLERRTKPILRQHVRHIPITERRCMPILESQVVNVPIKQRFVKNLVEQKIHPIIGPCPCPSTISDPCPSQLSLPISTPFCPSTCPLHPSSSLSGSYSISGSSCPAAVPDPCPPIF